MKHLPSRSLRSLALALLLGASMPPVARATTAPVDYPDAIHVPNGCYLSAITFIKRFSEENPGEETRVLSFAPRGWGGGHFAALVTWKGEWWIRDEYFGVFAVGQKVSTVVSPTKLEQKAANTFDRQVTVRRKAGQLPLLSWLPGHLTEIERAESAVAATRILPFKTEQFRVKSGNKELTFLFFRPMAGRIAVYEPSHGTAVAVCAETDAMVIVASVANRLGYTVDSVHSVFGAPATMVAAK